MLNLNDQKRIKAWVRTQYPEAPSNFIRLCEVQFAAFQVIALTLGAEWSDRVIKPLLNASQNKSDFLRRGITSPRESLQYTDRVIRLAEYLTRLVHVPNFDSKVEDLRRKDLEETFYELRVAHSLQKWKRLVKFVVPSKVKGHDFDMEAQFDKEPLAVEVKCLTDEPEYTAKLLYNRLKKAAGQLPPQGRGVIFIMLPPAWTAVDSFMPDTTRTIESVFRNYSRVNAAFFHWEEWKYGPPHGRNLRFASAVNPSPRVHVPNVGNLLLSAPTPPEGTRQLIDVSYI